VIVTCAHNFVRYLEDGDDDEELELSENLFNDAKFMLHREGLKKSTAVMSIEKETVMIHPKFKECQETNSGYDLAYAIVLIDEKTPDLSLSFNTIKSYTY